MLLLPHFSYSRGRCVFHQQPLPAVLVPNQNVSRRCSKCQTRSAWMIKLSMNFRTTDLAVRLLVSTPGGLHSNLPARLVFDLSLVHIVEKGVEREIAAKGIFLRCPQ